MSVKEFNFEEWFNTLNKGEDIQDNFEKSILELITNGDLHLSRYTIGFNIVPNNLGFIEKDENNKYFVEVGLPRNNNDISTGFGAYAYYGSENSSTDVKIGLNVDGKILCINGGTKIVNACAMYTEIKIRLTFRGEPFPVRVKYTSLLLQSNLREELMKKSFIQDSILYSEGVAMPIFYNVTRGEDGDTHLQLSNTPNYNLNVIKYQLGKGGLSFTN